MLNVPEVFSQGTLFDFSWICLLGILTQKVYSILGKTQCPGCKVRSSLQCGDADLSGELHQSALLFKAFCTVKSKSPFTCSREQ